MRHSCDTCGLIYTESAETCARCDRIEKYHLKVTGTVIADADYVLHELAHFILLFRSVPHSKKDWKLIEPTIARYSPGRSQFHEMRALALEYVSLKTLGWRFSLERMVRMSWPNVKDVASNRPEYRPWTSLVRSRTHMLSLVQGLCREVSPRNLRLYAGEVRYWSERREDSRG